MAAAQAQILSPLSWLWTISGSIITLGLYQKRRPLAWMDAGVGARIGVVVGLALVACLTLALAIGGLVARYGLHSMGSTDAQLTETIHASVERATTIAPVSPEAQKFWYSPEGRAGIMLVEIGVGSGILLILSAVGGAVSGFMRTRRKISV